MKLDLRQRCKRCGKLRRAPGPKSGLRSISQANWERYAPYCSYHCQEWARLEDAQRYINTLQPTGEE